MQARGRCGRRRGRKVGGVRLALDLARLEPLELIALPSSATGVVVRAHDARRGVRRTQRAAAHSNLRLVQLVGELIGAAEYECRLDERADRRVVL